MNDVVESSATHSEIILKLKNCGFPYKSMLNLAQFRSKYRSRAPNACTLWVWEKSSTVRRYRDLSSSEALGGSEGRHRLKIRLLHASKPWRKTR